MVDHIMLMAARLRQCATTAANDDLSEPGSVKRRRHSDRCDAMIEAADMLERFGAGVDLRSRIDLRRKVDKARARISAMRVAPCSGEASSRAAAMEFTDALDALEEQLLTSPGVIQIEQATQLTLDIASGKISAVEGCSRIMRLAAPAGRTALTPIVPGNIDRARQAIVVWRANRQTTYTAGNILSDLGVDILKALEAWSIIDQLRAPEGASVTLICDNPDFGPAPDAAIEICDDWTKWGTLRFSGDTVLDCLRGALKAREDKSFNIDKLPAGVDRKVCGEYPMNPSDEAE